MDINWYGQGMVKIKGKATTVVIDPFDAEVVGLKLPKDLEAQVVFVTHSHPDHNNVSAVSGSPKEVAGPGEYEISGVSIVGVPTYHDAVSGSERGRNTVYNLIVDGVNIVHLGDLGHILTEEQISEIGQVDILFIPVGGVYTIDSTAAAKVVSQLEPKIVIPVHYKIEGLKIELEEVQPFLKEMGAEQVTAVPKLSITREKLPEERQIVVLNRS